MYRYSFKWLIMIILYKLHFFISFIRINMDNNELDVERSVEMSPTSEITALLLNEFALKIVAFSRHNKCRVAAVPNFRHFLFDARTERMPQAMPRLSVIVVDWVQKTNIPTPYLLFNFPAERNSRLLDNRSLPNTALFEDPQKGHGRSADS